MARQPLPRIHEGGDPGGDVVALPIGGIVGPVPAELKWGMVTWKEMVDVRFVY